MVNKKNAFSIFSFIEEFSTPTEPMTRITSAEKTTLTARIGQTSMLNSSQHNTTMTTPTEKITMPISIRQTTTSSTVNSKINNR